MYLEYSRKKSEKMKNETEIRSKKLKEFFRKKLAGE